MLSVSGDITHFSERGQSGQNGVDLAKNRAASLDWRETLYCVNIKGERKALNSTQTDKNQMERGRPLKDLGCRKKEENQKDKMNQ